MVGLTVSGNSFALLHFEKTAMSLAFEASSPMEYCEASSILYQAEIPVFEPFVADLEDVQACVVDPSA